ncbi:MAG: PBP1A family penicillin-binding protein [Oscillospiraceae bacterium]|nr:PBP1A family penicillin-binding protein [Oscillospiraceae bacterium]
MKPKTKKALNTAVKVTETGFRGVAGLLLLALRAIATVLLIAITTGVLFACIFAVYVKTTLYKELDVDLNEFTLNQSSTILAYDSRTNDYTVLATLYSDENRVWVDYKDIPEYAEHAAVAIEDKRFYKHQGVDWYRTAGAMATMFLQMKSTFGGSTITQQLIKNVTQYDEATVKRKLVEIFRALDFEKHYSKSEIMENYLNTVNFGGDVYGIGAAAKHYFAKDVSELTLAECASIIGITNNPSLYNPYISTDTRANNRKRQLLILDEMLDQGYITEEEYDEAVSQQMVFKRGDATSSTGLEPYSWFVEAVIDDVTEDLMREKSISEQAASRLLFSAGYHIYTTMDPTIQDIVDEVYSDRSNIPSGYKQSETQELNSAIVIVDPHTGDLVALAGSMGEKTDSLVFNYATDMLRSPGSTVKPLASYGPAIELGYVMPYTTFNDGKDVKLSGTSWYPNNDNYSYSGLVTLRYALQRSINTVAAQLVDMVTPEVSYKFLTEHFGISSLDPVNDVAYAPMALGQFTYGVSPRELADAYTAYANGGVYNSSRTYSHITDAEDNLVYENVPTSIAAVSETTAYYITDLMTNVVNAGTGYQARLSNMPVAGKTGASSNWCDRWFVGYTPYYVGVVWSGYNMPEYMGSSNPSTGLWKQVMERVHEGLETKEFPVPDDMVWTTVCIDSGMLATDACKHEIRGDHTMTLRMKRSEVPRSRCDCHVLVEICGESHCIPCDDCPKDGIVRAGFLKLDDIDYPVLTPEFLDSDKKPVVFIESELEVCPIHNIDPVSGWYIDPKYGMLICPENGYYYSMGSMQIFNPLNGWEIEPHTGLQINPENGKYYDMDGKEYTGEVELWGPVILPLPPGFVVKQYDKPPEPTDEPVPTDEPAPTDDPSPPEPTDAIPQPEDDPNYVPPEVTPTPDIYVPED